MEGKEGVVDPTVHDKASSAHKRCIHKPHKWGGARRAEIEETERWTADRLPLSW